MSHGTEPSAVPIPCSRQIGEPRCAAGLEPPPQPQPAGDCPAAIDVLWLPGLGAASLSACVGRAGGGVVPWHTSAGLAVYLTCQILLYQVADGRNGMWRSMSACG